jgi:ribose transport system permease protein
MSITQSGTGLRDGNEPEKVTPPDAPGSGPVTGSRRSTVFGAFSRLGIVWVFILLVIAATIVNPAFLNPQNLINVLSQNVPVGLIAIGMTFIIIAGGFDLSVAAILAAGAVTYSTLSNMLPVPLALLIVAVLGLLLGGINAFLVTKAKVNAFIATLATASLFGGAILLYTGSSPITLNSDGGFAFLSDSDLLGVPYSVWLLALFAAIAWFVLSRTVFGRGIYAIGGNNEAARLAGLRVGSLRASSYIITGMCASLAGVVTASVIGVGQPSVDPTITLNSIAIVIIGGTSLLGGEGALWRTIIGIFIFGTINNVFETLAWPVATQEITLGAIVLGAVSLDAFSRSRRGSRKS